MYLPADPAYTTQHLIHPTTTIITTTTVIEGRRKHP